MSYRELAPLPDDAVRNLIRQGKVEQIYSVMQTNTSRGMQTMEQALADLVLRGVVSREVALTRSSKAEQLDALLTRGGMSAPPAPVDGGTAAIGGLRAAGA